MELLKCEEFILFLVVSDAMNILQFSDILQTKQ